MSSIDWPTVLAGLKTLALYTILPVVVALIKSERLALDNSTQANGLVHGYRLAKSMLALVPACVVQTAVASVPVAVRPLAEALVESMPADATAGERLKAACDMAAASQPPPGFGPTIPITAPAAPQATPPTEVTVP